MSDDLVKRGIALGHDVEKVLGEQAQATIDAMADEIERLTSERDNLRNVSEQYRKNSNEQFERANRAEDARDDALAQVAALREQAHKALHEMIARSRYPHVQKDLPADRLRNVLTDTAAAAAAHDARMIREGMERAGAIASLEKRAAASSSSDFSEGWVQACDFVAAAISAAIRAAMEDEK